MNDVFDWSDSASCGVIVTSLKPEVLTQDCLSKRCETNGMPSKPSTIMRVNWREIGSRTR
jgi:hypothetical protein